jgi:RND family efflux transporter MFP subunit
MKTKSKIGIGLIILVAIGGYFYYRSKTTPVAVPTETVKRGSVVETVSVTGELVPVEYADLSFKGLGTIDGVYVKEGDLVKEGDRIVSVDRRVLQSELNAARIAVRVAEANELLARKTNGTKSEAIRAKKLLSEQARESVKALVVQVNDGMLTAPIDGRVVLLDARLGETPSIGKIVARVSKSDDFVIEARIPESDIAKVRPSMHAVVTFDAFSTSEKFDAEVTDIDTAATVVQGVVSYVVKFHLSGADDRLKEEMTANIDIETAKRETALVVPFRALFKEGGITYAEVNRGENSFEKVVVTTGLEGDEGVIEILSGLREGDEVSIGAKQAK